MRRIEELINFIPPYKVIADIGCDHGYLIKYAFKKGIIKKAYAIDNKKGPLDNAKRNLDNYDNVIYLLSNGLSDLKEDVDVVIIAGMGGNLITKILEEGLNKTANVKRFIIEANRNQELIRLFAKEHNLKIFSEKIIEEDSIIYEIIVLEKGYEDLNAEQIKFGPRLLEKKDSLFIKKWARQLEIYENKKSSSLNEEIKLIKDVINYED